MKRTPRPFSMFADCSDLPLWSGTAPTVEDSPFAPAPVEVPVQIAVPLPGFDVELDTSSADPAV